MKNYALEISQSANTIRDLEAAISGRESKIESYKKRAAAAIKRNENDLAAELAADARSLQREVAVQKNALPRLKEEHKQLVAEYNAL